MIDFVEFLSSESESEDGGERKNNLTLNHSVDKGDAQEQQPKACSNQLLQKKQQTVALIHQFHTHIVSIEKEKRSQLNSKCIKDDGVFNEIQQVERAMTKERRDEYNSLKEGLNKIAHCLTKFKNDKVLTRNNIQNVEKLKILMEEIEASIMQLKEKQKLTYEDLLEDEKSLSMEIEVHNKKFNSWLSAKTQCLESKVTIDGKKSNKLVPQEVTEFEKFLLLSGGHLGGWDDYDHQLFIKLRKRFKKKEEFLAKAACEIPMQTYENIVQHLEWFEEYCILQEKKREAIANWKKLKLTEKKNVLATAVQNYQLEDYKLRKKTELFEKERQTRFQNLQEWKLKKLKEKEEQVAYEKENALQKLQVQQKLHEKRMAKVKREVQEYKLKKKEEEDQLQQARKELAENNTNTLTHAERTRIEVRNNRVLERKRSQLHAKELEREEKEKRLQKLKENVVVNVKKDPTRLYQMTKSWKNRKEDDSNSQNTQCLGLRALPFRAVPSWRQGTS